MKIRRLKSIREEKELTQAKEKLLIYYMLIDLPILDGN